MGRIQVDGVPYYSQRDNAIRPYVTCFPTSTSMVIGYLLQQLGLTKEDLGIDANTQIEDHVTAQAIAMRKSGVVAKLFGQWTWSYNPWTIAKVNEKIFNDLLNQINYRADFVTGQTLEMVHDHIAATGLPQVIMGNFKYMTKYRRGGPIGGHINCLVGVDTDRRLVICNDPYGDGKKNYSEYDGEYVEYPFAPTFIRNRANVQSGQKCWIIKISEMV